MGKARFRCLIRFELEPEIHQHFSLILRQQAVDALGRFVFSLVFCFVCLRVVRIRVACINLHEVVDQQHEHRSADVDFLTRIFLQQKCHHRHVPCVLRVVLLARIAADVRLAQDLFFFINLQNKIQLFFKTFAIHLFPLFFYMYSRSLSVLDFTRVHLSHTDQKQCKPCDQHAAARNRAENRHSVADLFFFKALHSHIEAVSRQKE